MHKSINCEKSKLRTEVELKNKQFYNSFSVFFTFIATSANFEHDSALVTKIPFLNKYFIFKIKMLQKFNLEINADQLSPLEPPRMSKLLKDTIIKILILGFFNLLTFINKNEKIPYPIRPKTLCPI